MLAQELSSDPSTHIKSWVCLKNVTYSVAEHLNVLWLEQKKKKTHNKTKPNTHKLTLRLICVGKLCNSTNNVNDRFRRQEAHRVSTSVSPSVEQGLTFIANLLYFLHSTHLYTKVWCDLYVGLLAVCLPFLSECEPYEDGDMVLFSLEVSSLSSAWCQ
jgi:hypothetical protein